MLFRRAKNITTTPSKRKQSTHSSIRIRPVIPKHIQRPILQRVGHIGVLKARRLITERAGIVRLVNTTGGRASGVHPGRGKGGNGVMGLVERVELWWVWVGLFWVRVLRVLVREVVRGGVLGRGGGGVDLVVWVLRWWWVWVLRGWGCVVRHGWSSERERFLLLPHGKRGFYPGKRTRIRIDPVPKKSRNRATPNDSKIFDNQNLTNICVKPDHKWDFLSSKYINLPIKKLTYPIKIRNYIWIYFSKYQII